jgi:hypothetical protein
VTVGWTPNAVDALGLRMFTPLRARAPVQITPHARMQHVYSRGRGLHTRRPESGGLPNRHVDCTQPQVNLASSPTHITSRPHDVAIPGRHRSKRQSERQGRQKVPSPHKEGVVDSRHRAKRALVGEHKVQFRDATDISGSSINAPAPPLSLMSGKSWSCLLGLYRRRPVDIGQHIFAHICTRLRCQAVQIPFYSTKRSRVYF